MDPIGNRDGLLDAWRSTRPRASAPPSALPTGWRESPPMDARQVTQRRVTDEHGIGWRVHEIVREAPDGGRRWIGLLFCCDVPGTIPEIRRVWRPLARLTDAELLDALQRAD